MRKIQELDFSSNVEYNYQSYRSQLKSNVPTRLCKIPNLIIMLKDINDRIENTIEKEKDTKGLSFEGFWSLSKYIIENISDKDILLDKPVNNRVINELLTAPILTNDGINLYIFFFFLNIYN